MNRTLLTRTLALAAVAAAAMVAAPTRVVAQMDTVIVIPTNPKADRMVASAQRMLDHGRWHAAAETYLRAARMRTADDPRASGNYTTAANLFYEARDLNAALDALVRAAEHALERGDVVAAAHAYANAGFVAGAKRDERLMNAMTNRARRLAGSPQLTVAQREEILRRTGDRHTMAVTSIR